MFIQIDPESDLPMYRQIFRRVVELIEEGTLKPGQKLPPTRELAENLGVSRRTVSRAYDELIATNYLYSKQGAGTFVNERVYEIKDLTPNGEESEPEPSGDRGSDGEPAIDWSRFMLEMKYHLAPPSGDLPEGTLRLTTVQPDPETFPFEEIKQISQNLLWNPEEYYFEYGNPQGHKGLLDLLHEQAELDGIDMSRNYLIVTNGFQQALDLTTDLLVEPGTALALEDPGYSAAINLARGKHSKTYLVPVTERGIDLERLEDVLARGDVRLLVCTPTLHNPTTVTMSEEKREELLGLAYRYQVPVLEDDWAKDLIYEGPVQPSLKALDTGDGVISVRSFSKTLLPGLRLGYMVIPRELGLPMIRLKRSVDKENSIFLQVLLEQFIKKGFWRKHKNRIQRHYAEKLETTLEALDEHMPSEVVWSEPEGGMFVWLRLPETVSDERAHEVMYEHKVEAGVYNYFNYHRGDGPGMRVAFPQLDRGEITTAVKRLGKVIREIL